MLLYLIPNKNKPQDTMYYYKLCIIYFACCILLMFKSKINKYNPVLKIIITK